MTAPVQRVKKLVFDTLADVKKAPETSNSHPSAYIDTVGCELCSKLKCSFFGVF